MVSNIRSTVCQLHQDLLSASSTLKSVEEPQLLSYGPGGKYDPHNDSEDFVNNELTRVVPRDWTMIWYLNDDYEGGKLDFCRLGITFNPKAGDMIIFPSYAEFEHAVTPVTRGVRKCLVTWIETDRRVYER
jgi:predicted 2-oxoglutarate/Fe(II)-dependent dioxygenase YbiX